MDTFGFVVIVAVLVIIMALFSVFSLLQEEERIFKECNQTCQDHGLPMLGYKGNKCVCVSGIGVRYNFQIGDKGND